MTRASAAREEVPDDGRLATRQQKVHMVNLILRMSLVHSASAVLARYAGHALSGLASRAGSWLVCK